MGESVRRLPDLEVLSGKVYQAKELISRLRQENRELTRRLEEIHSRLDTQNDAVPESTPSPRGDISQVSAGETKAAVELERLRRERREIRERVSRLLQQIESLDL
jgi:chromosome segregation ATPase